MLETRLRDTSSGSLSPSTADDSYIRLDGTSTTTASIPFAQGLTSAGQVGITFLPTGTTQATSSAYINPTGIAGSDYSLLWVGYGGAASLQVTVDTVYVSKHMLFVTDGSFDIGATGATRPRRLYLSTALNIEGSSNHIVLSDGSGGTTTLNGAGLGEAATFSFPNSVGGSYTLAAINTGGQIFSTLQTFSANITLSSASPTITFTDSGGDDYTLGISASSLTIRNTTDGRNDLVISGAGAWTINGVFNTSRQIVSTLATGTAPFSISSTTKVTNLNVDQVDGFNLDQGVLTSSSPTFVALNLTADSAQIVFDSDAGLGITTTLQDSATTSGKTVRLPDSSTTLAGIATTQTWTGVNTYNDYITIVGTTEASGRALWLNSIAYNCTTVNRYAIYSDVYVNTSGSGILTGAYIQVQTAGSGAQTGIVYGINGVAFNNLAGATVSQLDGMNFIVYNTGAQQVTLGRGAEVEGRVLGAGNMVTYDGFISRFLLSTSSGGTTTLTHFRVEAATRSSGTGTIGTQRGLYVPDLTSAFVTTAQGIFEEVTMGIHFRDAGTLINSSATNTMNFQTNSVENLELGTTESVFNDASNDIDFRVESNGETHALFVDAGNDKVGIATSSPGGRLHVDQSSTTAAIPVLTVDQADVSEEFIRFIGTSANGVLTQSIVEAADVATATIQGYLKVFVQDDGNQLTDQAYFVPIYTLA